MHVQVNSDSNVGIHEEFALRVAEAVENALSRFSDQVTRIEVHLSDVNAGKGGAYDKRCTMEARLAGLQPIAVSHQADTIQHAIDGASGKLERALDSAVGKLHHSRRNPKKIVVAQDVPSGISA